MDVFFNWLAAGFGVLFVVALAVAWWEHLVRQARPPPRPECAAAHAVSVDVRLDTQAGGLYESDAAARRATLDHTMGRVGRAARADGAGGSDAWTETSPMVLQPEAAPTTNNTAPADTPSTPTPTPRSRV